MEGCGGAQFAAQCGEILVGCANENAQRPTSHNEDASFLRFRSLTLRYTAPKKLSDKLHLKNLSGYLTGENLFTWTPYTGQDPEVALKGSDPFRVATDNSLTPPVIMLTVGVTVTF